MNRDFKTIRKIAALAFIFTSTLTILSLSACTSPETYCDTPDMLGNTRPPTKTHTPGPTKTRTPVPTKTQTPTGPTPSPLNCDNYQGKKSACYSWDWKPIFCYDNGSPPSLPPGNKKCTCTGTATTRMYWKCVYDPPVIITR